MRRIGYRILIGVLALGVLTGAAVLTAVCVCAGKAREARSSDCIVVLGARVRPDGRMSDSLLYRCERGLRAWQDGLARNIIVCGGQGSDEPMAEAEAMRAWFVENGVPEARIFTDATSTDTKENLANARAIMEAQGWTTAAVTTNDYHLERALWIARDAGMDACGLAARSPVRPRTLVASRLRESVSWVLYGLKKVLGE